MADAGTLNQAARTAKSAVRQALRRRNLRGQRGQRNAAGKLCTAKQLFSPATRCPALDSGNTDAIQPCLSAPLGLACRLAEALRTTGGAAFHNSFSTDF